jgi:putative oxidoreductase
MQLILNLHDRIFTAIHAFFAPWFLTTAARFSFTSVTLLFFWNSGKTKIGDSIFSPSFGAYAQVFPKKFESLGYDESLMSGFDTLVVLLGTYAEFILPAMIALGLFTRLASLGMIGFIGMMSVVDIYGHNADATTIGAMFDRLPYGLIMDQRLLWVFLLLVLVIKGGGPISMDYILTKFRK